ncbi:Fur family transcriptional regulator [Salisediminibacterium halotolerans]|uniref:Fur family transcriptional regulator n=1 Tax=Salisediminibacterium halotolerans TaxID=517425 RepID=UPI000EB59297|nr:Fur family transcriptional regulator [Salisediminibacterium halotolerans]RLJ78126.1 Fur family zinc uptake regulator [Actinophytocola xinjiangensis]RPE88535.1 Fur family zinc uptake regulator [Salisediminibacterium halotolerans]TWG37103.1 Fur family zinc uptake regulator [Salisediminibacterium halotolerans]GEL08799.1 zinc-specific metallo-regulatory protein [Salisediminibacterium halotolerans]
MNVDEAMDKLKEKGYKYTRKRYDMLALFSDESRYLAAKDVLESLGGKYSGLSFDTIYRNLSLFSELEILEETELDGEKKFRFSCSTGHHHHHLICLDCGKTREIEKCPMELPLIEEHEFQITGHKFEVYGYCQQCSAQTQQ